MSPAVETDLRSVDFPRPLTEHLGDLRRCLILALSGWLSCAALAYYFYPQVLGFLIRPPLEKLSYLSPFEPFLAQLKMSAILGFMLGFPWLAYQLWVFASPGLKHDERRLLFWLILPAYALFLLGASLGLFVAAPAGLKFLLSYQNQYLTSSITINSYLNYLSWMTLGAGALFQFPLGLVALGRMGLVRANALRRLRRHIFIGLLIAVAALTPGPDIMGQIMLALPAYILFELSVLAVAWLEKP